MKRNFIYLDNNATTRTCDEATKVMTDWIQSCSNPSGSSWLSNASRLLIEKSRRFVAELCGLKKNYYVLFTSGASESNCTILHMVVDAWYRNVGTTPHIVTSSIEHKSVLECLRSLANTRRVELTTVAPNMYGVIDPEQVEMAIQENTALVSIMFANNELGSINHVRRIGDIAHKRNIPFHTDAVQIFGKLKIDIPAFNIDALSMSFHKLYGPHGVGLLILRKSFVDGYGLQGQIAGTQQHGLRGGTENIPGIAGAVVALSRNFNKRKTKNARLAAMRELLIQLLSKRLPVVPYSDFYGVGDDKKWDAHGRALCILGPPAEQKNSYLPSTLLMSVIDYDQPFCNVKLKTALEAEGVIVSIGSACNTASSKASHVIEAIKAPSIVRRGVLRVSLGDFNTPAEIREFARIFLKSVSEL